MIPQPARTFCLIVLALALLTELTAESVLHEDPSAVTLPLEIEINGHSQGEVVVRTDASLAIVELEGSLLKELLSDKVATDLIPFVESLPEGFHTLESYQTLGLEILLDLERLVIALQIQEKSVFEGKGPQRISLGYQRNLNFESHSKEATLSGYANLRFQANYSSQEDQPSKSSYFLGISHLVNLKGYALEGESVWTEEDGLRARELRVVKDLPNQLLRFSAGDISTPINELQRGFQLFGLNIAKEFGIQPYRTFTPTSSASFDLSEASTVRVNVNGNTTRTLQLEPGSYDLEDFKLAAGPNNMDLRIVTESGLVDTLNISEFGALNQLGAKVSTYSLSYGFPRSSASDQDARAISTAGWYERYAEKEPIFSGYYKRGITNQLTATFDAQGSSEWNRIGASAYTASERFGSLSLGLSRNQADGVSGSYSARVTWARDLGGYQFSGSSLYSGRTYQLSTANAEISPNSVRMTNSLNISRMFYEKLNVSTSFLHQLDHSGRKSENTSLSLGQRFGSIYASLSFRYARSYRETEYSSYLSCSWNPAKRWRANSRARVSTSKGGTSISSDFDYSNRRKNDYINARINASYSDIGYNVGGMVNYQSSLYSASLSHSQVYGAIDDYTNKGFQSTLNANTAIAFADGAFGFANKIGNSFAIVSKHSAWSDVQLGINPTLGGFEKKSSSSLYSPVLQSLTPYREAYATIQTVESDLFLERNDYYFFPSYKRGTKLKLGSDAIYAIRGTIHYSDGDPVKYKALRFTSSSGEKVDTFTNGAGRFMVNNLKPGRYLVSVANTQESLAVTVEKGEKIIFAGSLRLEESQ